MSKTYTVEVPDSLVEQLEQLAAERGISLPEFFVQSAALAAAAEPVADEEEWISEEWPAVYSAFERVFHRLAQ